MDTPDTQIPCHVIAGPLGVGKTTAILDYLAAHNEREHVGVLVNDFGPVGLDGSLIAAGAPDTVVKAVRGGCICCTLLATLIQNLQALREQPGLTRVIIEPSGMAQPPAVVSLLRKHAEALAIEIRPVIVLLDAATFSARLLDTVPYFRAFRDAADVLVFNRCDNASEAQQDVAMEWAAALAPPKLKLLKTEHGRLPDEVFELVASDAGAGALARPEPTEAPPRCYADGITLPPERSFDGERLILNLTRLTTADLGDARLIRFKGMFNTPAGWQRVELASNAVTTLPSAHGQENLAEWVSEGRAIASEQMLIELERPA